MTPCPSGSRATVAAPVRIEAMTRGTPVLAAARWIQGPGWGLVLKIDRDEALEDFRQARYLTGAAAIFLILAVGLLLIGLWRQRQRAQLLREQIRQERAIFNLKSYAEKIVASVRANPM